MSIFLMDTFKFFIRSMAFLNVPSEVPNPGMVTPMMPESGRPRFFKSRDGNHQGKGGIKTAGICLSPHACALYVPALRASPAAWIPMISRHRFFPCGIFCRNKWTRIHRPIEGCRVKRKGGALYRLDRGEGKHMRVVAKAAVTAFPRQGFPYRCRMKRRRRKSAWLSASITPFSAIIELPPKTKSVDDSPSPAQAYTYPHMQRAPLLKHQRAPIAVFSGELVTGGKGWRSRLRRQGQGDNWEARQPKGLHKFPHPKPRAPPKSKSRLPKGAVKSPTQIWSDRALWPGENQRFS